MAKGNKLVGIDENWVADAMIGVLIGIIFIAVNKLFPGIGTIGIPNVQSLAEVTGKFIIICIAAPIFEELFFRDFVLDFFDSKIFNMPFILAAIISSIAFSVFHLTAYGGSLEAAGGSFVSAFLVGMMLAYVRKFTDSNIANIVIHAVINLWIGFFSLAVIFI